MTDVLSRPSSGLVEGSVWLPRRPTSAGRARVRLRRFLTEVNDGDLFLQIGELLLTELVTNAVRHARTPSGRLLFARFELSSGLLRIEVHDANDGKPQLRVPGVDVEAGRGLWLVDQLSVRWGCCPRTGGIGKTVWCVIAPAEVRSTGEKEQEADR